MITLASSVYLSHTLDWATHYLAAWQYSTSDWTTSVWTAQTWLVLYLSLMTYPSIYRKTVSSLTTVLFYLLSPMLFLPLTSTSEIVCMVSRRAYSTSHESHAWGLPGVHLLRAVMTNLNHSPPKELTLDIYFRPRNKAWACDTWNAPVLGENNTHVPWRLVLWKLSRRTSFWI